MAKRTKAETEKFYRQLVAEQEKSGLSIRAFGATRGIPAGTLSCWRHELRQRDAARARRRKRATKARFLRVSVVGTGTAADAAVPESATTATAPLARVVYEVVLGQDRVLRVPAEFDEARVAALVRAVVSC